MNRSRSILLLAAALLTLAAPAATAAPHPSPEAPTFQGTGHEHQWVKSSKREWVPPKYKKVRVGTDKKGRPIYEKRLVRKGHYKPVYVTKCRVCGREK